MAAALRSATRQYKTVQSLTHENLMLRDAHATCSDAQSSWSYIFSRIVKWDLVQALKTLGTIRRKRFSSTLPVWLCFEPARDELSILEARRGVRAIVRATGY